MNSDTTNWLLRRSRDAAKNLDRAPEWLSMLLRSQVDELGRAEEGAATKGANNDRVLCERMASNGLLRPFGEPDRNGCQTFHVTQTGADLLGVNLP